MTLIVASHPGAEKWIEDTFARLSSEGASYYKIDFIAGSPSLDLPRIRLMQKCLPPGNPLARPLDLFDRQRPSLWHMHCRAAAGEWDAVGVFNFEDEPQERTIELASLGLPAGAEVAAFEFWEERFFGTHKDRVPVSMPPRTARILLLHRLPSRPQVIATNMHVLGGYHEIERLAWHEPSHTLSGTCRRMPGVAGRVYFYVPPGYRPRPGLGQALAPRLAQVGRLLWRADLVFERAQAEFTVVFDRPGK